MSDALRVKLGPLMVPVPALVWRRVVLRQARAAARALAALTADQRRVRAWVVAALPDRGEPLDAARIAGALGLAPGQVTSILAELERRLVFLARDAAGAVSWAYPVTVDATPHHLTFETGERMTAA